MSCLKPAGRAVNSVPTRRPFAGVTIIWRCVQAQPGNNGEGVTLARVDRDPFAGAGFPVAAKLGRTYWRADQASRTEHVGDCARTIVSVIVKCFVAATVSVWLMAKLVRGPDRAFHRERRFLWRSRFSESKMRGFTRHDGSGTRKKFGRRVCKDQS